MLPSTMDIPVVVLQVSPKMSKQLRFSKDNMCPDVRSCCKRPEKYSPLRLMEEIRLTSWGW